MAAYANLSHRINWVTGISQEPYYFYEPSRFRSNAPGAGAQHLRHQHPATGGAVRVCPGILSRSAGSSGSRAPAVCQRGRRCPERPGALRSRTGLAAADPTLETNNRPGINYVQPPPPWSSTTHCSATPHHSSGAAAGWSSPRRSATGSSPRSRPITGAMTRSSARRLCDAPAVLRPGRPGCGPVQDLRRRHRSDSGQHLGLLSPTRVSER